MTSFVRQADSVAPALLLSMPQLADPNFARSVVLLCQHNAGGAWGLVVNRPTGRAASTAIQLDPPVAHDNGLELWIGGPVETERGCLLLAGKPVGAESLEVSEGLFISGSAVLLRQLIEGDLPRRARLLVGYAGWGPGQLEEELRQSAWLISDVDLGLLFEVEPARMWEAAIRRLGADPGTLQMSSGVH